MDIQKLYFLGIAFMVGAGCLGCCYLIDRISPIEDIGMAGGLPFYIRFGIFIVGVVLIVLSLAGGILLGFFSMPSMPGKCM